MKKPRIITIIFSLIPFLSVSPGYGATRVYLPDTPEAQAQFNQVQGATPTGVNASLGLTPQGGLQLLRQRTDQNNITHKRYNQLFKNIPVWGHHIMVATSPSGKIESLHGTKVEGIAQDIGALTNFATNALDVLSAMKARHIANSLQPDGNWTFENEVRRKIIYIGEDKLARVCYEISFFADLIQGGEPSRPVIIVDAASGSIILEFDTLTDAGGIGPGGNEKIGQYYYGTNFPAFDVTQSGSDCIMNTTDVKTVNLNHGTFGSTAFSYDCAKDTENTFKFINGAYSPINDAHFFGQVVYDMYNGWFGVPPLTFQLMMRVHYSNNYENAFWNGSSMTFGDGHSYFYPLVSLDVVAHEVSHGFTEQNSDLIYSGQSGGINEAFSDMAGEAAEYYSRGSADYEVGRDIRKGNGALRYMHDPTQDNVSIDSANDYYSGMDVHYSSGVFNKAFYLLAETPGWGIQKAFEVFVTANLDYWEPSTDFQQGAEGARDAATGLGYSAQAVQSAFAAVDVFIDIPQSIASDFSYVPDASSDLIIQFTDESTCSDCDVSSWSWDFGDGSTSDDQNPSHEYSQVGSYAVELTVTGDNGQSDTIVKMVQAGQVIEYCDSGGSNQKWEWISAFELGPFSNSTGAGSYSDYTDMIVEASTGTAMDVTLTPGYDNGTYPEYWRIWADLNRDGDFNDIGEDLYAGSGSGPLAGTIVVPAGTAPGSARLRVSMSYGEAPGPCGSFAYGEVEDYTLLVLNEPLPPEAGFSYAVDGLTVTFSDTSNAPGGKLVDWEWSFGDGDTSQVQNPTHAYDAAGTYDVSLKVIDSNGQADSVASSLTVSEPVDYCASQGNSQSYEYVSQVDVGSFSNASGASGYSDFTDLTITMQQDTLYPVTLTPGFPGSAYTEYWRIWIDMNRDGDFEDAGEQVFEGSASSAVSGTISVPGTMSSGRTRLRVSMRYGGAPSTCGSFSWGEVEDYELVIPQQN